MEDRVENCFQCKYPPYKFPSLWIKSIKIRNTALTRKDEILSIDFNPQLTTIIGGRGSGKSSILRFIRGVFNRKNELNDLDEILKDQNDFFKITGSDKLGVLKENTEIVIDFVRDNVDYKIIFDQNKEPQVSIEQKIENSEEYRKVEDEHFIDFFKLAQYSQKQIYAIAQKPNSLRDQIDTVIPEVNNLKSELRQCRNDYLEVMASIRSMREKISEKGKLNTIINDLNNKISLLQKSGIADFIRKQQKFIEQKTKIENHFDSIRKLVDEYLLVVENQAPLEEFSSSAIEENYRDTISAITKDIDGCVKEANDNIKKQIRNLRDKLKDTRSRMENSQLYIDEKNNANEFKLKKAELESKGITDMTDFEKFSEEINNVKIKLNEIVGYEKNLEDLQNKKKIFSHKIFDIRTKITQERQEFLERNINSEKIKVEINRFGSKQDFISRFRTIVQKDTGYGSGIENLVNDTYSNNSIDDLKISKMKEKLHKIHDDTYEGYVDGRFSRLISELTPEQMDNLDLFYPEDEIVMKYKNKQGGYQSLAIASAGQKTTAILTFILSIGDAPLILDQPEDDLDNKLVYDLIVKKIREIKKHRQVIVVTHNANIPVNGDAEYVVSMSSNSHNLKKQTEGTVEEKDVKEEICDVMEGGKEAFSIRAKRYGKLD